MILILKKAEGGHIAQSRIKKESQDLLFFFFFALKWANFLPEL